MVVKEKVLNVPNLEDLVTPETTLDEYRSIIGQFITDDNKEVLGGAQVDKVVRASLFVAEFGTKPFTAKDFHDKACIHPDIEDFHLSTEQVVEIITVCKRIGLFGSYDVRNMFINRNPKLQKNLQRILGEYQKNLFLSNA